MKLTIFIFSFLLSFSTFSQISFSSKHIGSSRNFKKGTLKKFKNTKTIFVLSSILDKETYEKILKETWTVTPYKVIEHKDFEIENFLNDNYSIAQLTGFKKIVRGKYTSTELLHIYIDFRIYDSKKIFNKLNKLSDKKRAKKRNSIIDDYSLNIARFYLFPNDEFMSISRGKDIDTIVDNMYSKDFFYNYNQGYLKNYFQKVNDLIIKEKVYWLYKDEYLPELKNVAQKVLFIPSYIGIKFNPWKGKDSVQSDENIKKLFKKYKYKYEIISNEALNNRINNNEEFYYLRYVRVNSQKFLQIVNSKTGEIIYREYISGMSYNLKGKYIKHLNKAIKKALKK